MNALEAAEETQNVVCEWPLALATALKSPQGGFGASGVDSADVRAEEVVSQTGLSVEFPRSSGIVVCPRPVCVPLREF